MTTLKKHETEKPEKRRLTPLPGQAVPLTKWQTFSAEVMGGKGFCFVDGAKPDKVVEVVDIEKAQVYVDVLKRGKVRNFVVVSCGLDWSRAHSLMAVAMVMADLGALNGTEPMVWTGESVPVLVKANAEAIKAWVKDMLEI